ncbi:MAG: response regulator [Candidatus Omnitrophota bacterium]
MAENSPGANNKRKILVIDDDRDVCEVLLKNLVSFGYDADSAFSGQEGIEKTKQGGYDLIILDLKLPDLYGTEVLKEIRKFNKDVVIIILTAYPSVETAIETLKNNQAADFIYKPFNIDHLRIVIESQLEHRKVKKDLILMGRADIGKEIKQARINKNLSLDMLARKTGLSKSFLSELERGKKYPRLDSLEKIAQALEVNVNFFFRE